jgi:hypothetical protein
MAAELEYLPERSSTLLMSGILTDLQRLVEPSSSICEIELRQPVASLTVVTLGLGLFLFESLLVSMTGVYLLYWVAGDRMTSRDVDIGNTPASLVSFELSHNQRKESSR